MKCNKQLKYSNYVAFSHFHGTAVNNSGLNIINGYSKNNRVYEQIVNRIEISDTGYLLVTCDGMASVVDVFYKKSRFLTREEAEAALKEMEGKEK